MSSSSLSSGANTQSAAGNASADHPSLYRRVDYYDGKSVRVVESRRRSKKVERRVHRPSDPNQSTRIASISSPTERPDASQLTSSSLSAADRKLKGGSTHGGHVISYRSRAHANPVIVHPAPPHKLPKSSTATRTHNDALVTPPSTPRMGRLPTPDLDDLDRRPFCHCCIGTTHVKYCASCGQSL